MMIKWLLIVWAAAYVAAFQSFAGSNLYYAPGLYQNQQEFLFSNMQKAGMKVLRVWLGMYTLLSPLSFPISLSLSFWNFFAFLFHLCMMSYSHQPINNSFRSPSFCPSPFSLLPPPPLPLLFLIIFFFFFCRWAIYRIYKRNHHSELLISWALTSRGVWWPGIGLDWYFDDHC